MWAISLLRNNLSCNAYYSGIFWIVFKSELGTSRITISVEYTLSINFTNFIFYSVHFWVYDRQLVKISDRLKKIQWKENAKGKASVCRTLPVPSPFIYINLYISSDYCWDPPLPITETSLSPFFCPSFLSTASTLPLHHFHPFSTIFLCTGPFL